MENRIDPYKHKERYLRWKEGLNGCISGVTLPNSQIILQYLADMERGINIASESVRGCRSFTRLNALKDRMIYFARRFKELYNLDKITDMTEELLISFFSDMQSGTIRKNNGEKFQSVDTPARIFKAFWHWHQKISKKQGKELLDITQDLDTRQKKPEWVYLTERELKLLCENAKFEYKVLILFLFDSGIRSPTELMNVKVSDLMNNFKELNIRQETSKTFGRRIKLMLCSDYLKEYINFKKLRADDFLFQISPNATNKYLKRLGKRILGDKQSPAGAKYSELTMYDFRHISCCYWLPRYKSESALKYRFGWKKSDKIHYYSELLGMKDTIAEEDMLVDVTKTEIEKELQITKKQNEILQDKIATMEMQMAKISELTQILSQKIKLEAI